MEVRSSMDKRQDQARNQSPDDCLKPPQPKIVTTEMTKYCFDVLRAQLWRIRPPAYPKFPNDRYPLFVTWSKGKEKILRGCIGTFQPLPLHEGLRDYALDSALRDSRFDPISIGDLEALHVSVSVLCDFEKGAHYLDWTLGVHGIRISFMIGTVSKTATYLPEIAPAQGWTKLQTIDSLLKKGGFNGKISREIRQRITLVRYKSQKISMSYYEYLKADLAETETSRSASTCQHQHA